MKSIRILFAVVCVAATQVAMADTPPPQALGTINAILRYCSDVDKRDAAMFNQLWKAVTGIQSDVNSYKGNADFQASYNTVYAELQKTSSDKSALTCAAGVPSPRQTTDADDRRKPVATKRK
jgi:hypothetical protein